MTRQNIILVGFMGTGKTVVGQALASALGFKYIDTDLMVEAEAKKSIPEIFNTEGEPAFRKYEKQAIQMITHLKGYVVATGGGAVMMDENIAAMKKAGLLICLYATPEVIFERTRHDNYRPLLQTHDPMKRIKSLLNIRMPQYKKADHLIDTSDLSVDKVVEKIISIWTAED